jgi:hypothetical protein
MLYCTRCGSDLKGSKVRCPVCGYEVLKMKTDVSKPREVRKAETEPKPWAPPIPDQRTGSKREERKLDEPVEALEFEPERKPKVIPEEEEEEEDPRYVDGCSICGSTPVHRCFFTLAPLCKRHTVYMQIYVRSMAFGERVPASPDIASQKEGRNPTKDEAEDAGMFFAIKPYHEWKRVRG